MFEVVRTWTHDERSRLVTHIPTAWFRYLFLFCSLVSSPGHRTILILLFLTCRANRRTTMQKECSVRRDGRHDGWTDGKREERRLSWTLLRQQISHRCRLQGRDGEHGQSRTQSRKRNSRTLISHAIIWTKCLGEGPCILGLTATHTSINSRIIPRRMHTNTNK